MIRGKIPEEVLELIRERTAIEKVIGEYVPLKHTGRHFKGLCPFHQEKTPSFTVNTDLQIFKCFGCGESGNVFNFLMKYENISFPEAVEKLATSAGVTLPDAPVESEIRKNELTLLFEVMNTAWKLYVKNLQNDAAAEHARKYLANRGINEKLIKHYGLGYAPDQWDFLSSNLKTSSKVLVSAGLLIQNQDSGKLYDRFRNRIMFPIRDHRKGQIIAFGGRTLGDDPAKYINSPDSPIYHKSQVLYGLYEAQKEIRVSRVAILVEGYFDRISLDRAGFSNTVAPCGTSITPEQIRLLKRSADEVHMLFDSDPAGMKAARKALELCLVSGIETKAIPLPEGKDPDDVLRASGAEALKQQMSGAMPGLDFLIQSAARRFDLTQSKGRREAVEDMIPFLADVENSIDRGAYVSRIADLLSVPSESVMELCYRASRNKQRQAGRTESRDSAESSAEIDPGTIDLKERDLFCFLLQNPEYLSWEHNPLTPDSMQTRAGNEVYRLIREAWSESEQLAVAKILEKTDNRRIRSLLIELFDDPVRDKRLVNLDPLTVFQTILHDFREKGLKNELHLIKRQLGREGISVEELDFLLRRKLEILEELNPNSSLDA